MVAPVILYGSPVLRKSSADITGEDNITGISETLFSTLKNAKGIGLTLRRFPKMILRLKNMKRFL
jgi:peptide deformylase